VVSHPQPVRLVISIARREQAGRFSFSRRFAAFGRMPTTPKRVLPGKALLRKQAHLESPAARSTDVLARTQVLAALADLAFPTGDAIQANSRKTHP
jgi:hypothetical protein